MRFARWFLLPVFLSLFISQAALAQSPSDAVVVAVADARRLPPTIRVQTRYFSLYSVPVKERAEVLKALAFHCNSLSREAEIIPPRLVAPDLVAVVMLDYGWERKTWDRLQDVDPYFHAQLVQVTQDKIETVREPTGRRVSYDSGRTFQDEVRIVEKKVPGSKKVVTASAPWLDTAGITELISLTQTPVPIVRADWFIVQTGIARKDQVGYYDFLELGKKEKDFQKLIGADPEASRRVRREIAAVLARSGVAVNNRRIVRFQSITGGYWTTEDFKTSKDRQNVLKFLDGETEPPHGDASEQYGVLPNGLLAFWLQNDKGERQDVVPPDIATDGNTASNDRQIYSGKSCISCHVEGIRPINDYARRIFRNQIQLQSVDYEKFVRLRQLYLSDLEGQVKRDQEEYGRILFKTNGLTPPLNARLYGKVFEGYTEADLGPAEVAAELGVTEQRFMTALKRYASRTGNLNPIIVGLLQQPPVPIRRDHFEEVYTDLQAILKGVP